MKTFKKLLLGLCFLILSLGVVGIVGSHRASAATLADAQQCEKSLKFPDIAHIECQTTQGKVVFTDQEPDDSDSDVGAYPGYCGLKSNNCQHVVNYRFSSVFCDPGNIDAPFVATAFYDYPPGITINGGNNLTVSDAGKSLGVKLNLGYSASGTTNCTRYGGGGGKDATIKDTGAIKYLLQFKSNSIDSLDGVTKGSLGNQSYGLVNNYNDGSSATGVNILAFSNGNYATCSGKLIMVTTSGGANSAIAKAYILTKNSAGVDKTKYPDVYTLFTAAKVTGCSVYPDVLGSVLAIDQSFGILGTPPKVAFGTSNPGTSGNTDTTPTCESNFSYGFEWALCPVLHLADGAAGAFNSFIEDQLCVNVGNSTTAGGVECKGNSIMTAQLHTAWRSIAYISTALLVIVMLVMVFSQAFGAGIFDAYAIRKMLPKLVAAAILIQLSWVMCKFAIDISNDLGKGIQQILYAPFGGQSNMDLAKLVGNGVKTSVDNSSSLADGFVFFVALGGAAAIVFNLPGLLMLALYMIIGLFIAFVTLIVRQILIVMLVILAPLALIAWVLPGTSKYWDMWFKNFSKLLAMFPLIMALIASGRIFAYITSQSTSASIIHFQPAVTHLGGLPVPYVADIGSFAGLAIIIIAFFAPYFMIPMTFRWGGQLMSAAGNAIANNKVTKGMQEKSKGFSDDVGKRYKGNMADRYSRTAPGRRNALRRGFLRMSAGQALPTERKTRALLGQAGEYKEDLVKGKMALMHNDYSEQLAMGKTVGQAKKYIRDKYGWSKDKYDQRAFYNWLIDSKSGMELGDEDWRTDGGTKQDLAKTQGFISAMHADGGRYGAVAGWYPTFQPFYSELGGGPKPEDYIDGGKRTKASENDDGTVRPARVARNRRQAELFAEDERYIKWLDSVNDPRELTSVRPELYKMLADNHKRLREEFGIESDASVKLRTLIEKNAATQPGQYALAPLAGGGSEGAGKHLDAIFGAGYIEGTLNLPAAGARGAGTRPVVGGESTEAATATTGAAPASTTSGAGADGSASPEREASGGSGRRGGAAAAGEAGAAGAGINYEALAEAVARGTRQANRSTLEQNEARYTQPVTRIETEAGGVLEIPHERGENITPGGVILPSGTRSAEDNKPSENPDDKK